ncbi:hypothetical protein JCM10908_004814 [Rhodotorula pacifica]|uniref:uncharacterized protein n=1 Tax=Rhodotorula pacifica TaxID=1495444 RepID=UPI00316EB130
MANQNRPGDLNERCLPQYSALDNTYGHNPCRVARYLIDQCDFYEYYPLHALDLQKGDLHYPLPDPDQATACLCSMGVYNLVQACAACQQTGGYNSTLWSNWVSNCTYSMVNSGHVFPTSCPSHTEIPAWATVDSASGSLSVGSVYQRTSTGNATLLVSAIAAASTAVTQAAQTYTEVTIPLQTNGSYASGDSDRRKDAIAGAAVAVAFVVILFAATIVYFRKRRRRVNVRRYLDDVPADLAECDMRDIAVHGVTRGVTTHGADKFTSPLVRDDERGMVPTGGSDMRYTPGSRRSIATNSVSSGLPVTIYRARDGSHRSIASLDTQTRTRPSSVASAADSGVSLDDHDDDSLSPFSDLNRPLPSLLATRDNLHRRPTFDRSYSSFSLTPSSAARSSVTDDDRSSLRSRNSGAPSSNRAIWGRMEQDDDDDNPSTPMRPSF